MKVKKYKKLRNGKYQVIIDDEEVILYDDIIIKHQLLLKQDIAKKELELIKKDNDFYSNYLLAVNYINRKLRSKEEIKKYLSKQEINSQDINKILDLLEENKLINDSFYVEAYIHDKMSYSNDGPLKIKNELEKLKIDLTIIDDKLTEYNTDIENEKIKKYIDKKLKNNNKSLYELKNSILNYLVFNGYHRELVLDNLNNLHIDESDIYEKEYQKLYNKLSKKYKDKELEYKIKQKLYQKGFHN